MDLFLNEEIKKNLNRFPDSIIDNKYLEITINYLFFTIIDKNELKEYLKKNNNEEIKNKIILTQMLEKELSENMMDLDILPNNITSDFTNENYKNILSYLYNNTKKKEFFPDLLEFCLIIALSFVVSSEIGHTINIYLYDNFSKIKKAKTFEKLQKNFTYIVDILTPSFKKYIKETDELNFNEEKYIFINEKKEIINPKKCFIDLFENLPEPKIKSFFSDFEKNINLLLNLTEKETPFENNISPLIYLGMIIKFGKLQFIYNKTQDIPKELENYIFSQIKMLYYYPKSAYIFLFYILFAVYKIRNSTLINIDEIPYEYDISQAFLEFDSSFVMASVIKYDNRIKKIIFNENRFGEIGLFETGKNLFFNNNVKIVNIGKMNITTDHLRFFKYGLHENKSVIELNLNNNMKIDNTSGKEIGEILLKFPNLIILNLNKCKLGKSLNYVLNTILRNNMIIQQLYLSKTLMEQTSIKILSMIVEKKSCSIEILSVNNCDFNNKMGRKFLKSLCQNSKIQELYMYNCNLNDTFYNEISKLIISGNLNVISFYKNKFSKFETILKLIKLTSINNNNTKNDSQLSSLDLSLNPIKRESICEKNIDLFIDICEKTKLNILDVSQIINGEIPKKEKKVEENIYDERVEKLNNSLNKLKKDNFDSDIYF